MEKPKIDSDDDLPQGKTLTFHNAVIEIKSTFNKTQNYDNYNIFLEKWAYCILRNTSQNILRNISQSGVYCK